MTTADLVLIFGSLGALLATFGGGVKWLMAHVDAKTNEARIIESDARTLMHERLAEDIRIVRAEMVELRREKAIFLKRIYQLERFIHLLPGISIPDMEGWPPHD